MSPFILFQYSAAAACGVILIGVALRVLRALDLALKAFLASAPKERK